TDELARCCRAFEDRAYTAGLLHDVGRLGLLMAYPIEYAGLLRNAGRNVLELLGFGVVEPIRPCSPEEIQATLPPLLAKRIAIDANHWRETVERRIRCYADPDGAMSETSELEFEPAGEESELPVAELAKLRLPDPNAGNSLPRELLMLVGIGLLFTILIVALVYFAVK